MKSLRFRIASVILLPLLLVGAQTLGLIYLGANTQRLERSASQATEIYSMVAQLGINLLEMRSEITAYQAARQSRFLDEALASEGAVRDTLNQLAVSTADEPVLASTVAPLSTLTRSIISRMQLASGSTPSAFDGQGLDRDLEAFFVLQKRFGDQASILRNDRLSRLDELWRLTAGVLALAAFCELVIAIILSFVVYRYIARRLNDIGKNSVLYAQGKLPERAGIIAGTDEIARLDQTLRKMAETIATREADLRASVKRAESASEAKSAFVATMSHEIRTPLNGVIAMAELLSESNLSERDREYVQTIEMSGQLLLGVINDILDFSKISAGKMELSYAQLPLAPFVESILALFANRAAAKQLDFKLEIHPDTPAVIVTDELRLRQVLTNLVGNAVKFTEAGGVKLSVSATPTSADSSVLKFSVHDTGIGIPEAMRDTLFEPFEQADMSDSRRFGGTGLGLAIARQLINMMGGTIGFESTIEHGSVFWCTIPMHVLATSPAIERRDADATPAANHDQLAARILLVEDNEINQRVAIRLLERLGLTPEVAANGLEALAATARTTFDLILMDVQMPEMDGYAATRELRLRESGTQRHTPIVAMTANAMAEDREACFAVGMDDFLSKPVTLAKLKAIIDKWLVVSAVRP